MSAPVVTLCSGCAGADPALADALRAALAAEKIAAVVRDGPCMSGCARSPTLAVRAPGKTAYLFGEIGAGDLPELIRFLALYERSPDGALQDARPLGGLRFKAIARIPGMPPH